MEVGFGPRIIFNIGNIPISETVVMTWFVMAVLFAFAFVATRRFERVPSGLQNVTEAIVDEMNGLTAQTMGADKKGFAPYMGTLFLFLLVSNILGIFGLRPPTADVNVTFALALTTFAMIHFFGAKTKGLGTYLKGFLEPFAFMLPLNILSELSLPISLAFRLFGNIVGGFIIMALLYGGLASVSGMIGLESFPIFAAGIPVALHLYFDLFAGVLQTFIFVMLSMVFIAMAMD
ncbi:ATP synthase F0, A subunit [Alkaliphilus metalliredigens QYMF]|uniref:ATP synthase subunit a n=1 Tax=Alkaliphilus metalliredigens (strain QYMF) TaxID=293826 RepID=A6TK58_ALKMQ|nr:F0F1 ATP synthase subunit A [Alkaliphilus metalliredigens]ABR46576.1 ATP synthase F0, A subunit [Alkaliphilus metalliredigens QYMF]